MIEEAFQTYKTSFHTWRIITFASLDSTNTHLTKNSNFYKPFTCIIAQRQTSGHGKHKRVWHSVPHKDLSCSLLVPLQGIDETLWSAMTQATALAVAKTLEALEIPASIKWPNDVLVRDKKICGILCVQQNRGASSHKNKTQEPVLIVGIGLNVNSTKQDMRRIDQPATSVFIERAASYSIEAFLQRLLEMLSECLQSLKKHSFVLIRNEIQRRWYDKTKKMKLVIGKETHEGVVSRLNEDASLQFQCAHCGEMRVYSGELFQSEKTPTS